MRHDDTAEWSNLPVQIHYLACGKAATTFLAEPLWASGTSIMDFLAPNNSIMLLLLSRNNNPTMRCSIATDQLL